MLNEEKIRLMTELAVLEKKNGSQMKIAAGYFKSDFISRHLIRSFVCYTFCSVLAAGIWLLLHLELLVSTLVTEELLQLLKQGMLWYTAGLLAYLFLTGWIYGKRYDLALRMNRIYLAKLKHLDKRYEYHQRSRALAREGKRV